jgi:hypothetical protein
MKTNLTSRLVLVLCVAAALVVGCGGSDDPTPQSCDKTVGSYEADLNAYIADPTNKSKCQAFKSSAANLLDCPTLAAGKRKEYEDMVASISCD